MLLRKSLDAERAFLTVDAELARGLDADADLIAFDGDDGDTDVLADDKRFTDFTRKDEHRIPFCEEYLG